MKTTGDGERQVWAAILFVTGQADVFGTVRGSPRPRLSFDDAKLEAEGWAEEMRAGPIAWARIEDGIAVGRIKGARRRAAQHSAAAQTAAAGVKPSREIAKMRCLAERTLHAA
jgi:hypothetical protein